jgi:hypothetical protein
VVRRRRRRRRRVNQQETAKCLAAVLRNCTYVTNWELMEKKDGTVDGCTWQLQQLGQSIMLQTAGRTTALRGAVDLLVSVQPPFAI